MGPFLKRHMSGLLAFICGLLLLPWILGVPGNPTPKGAAAWSLGLVAILSYLVLYQCVRSSQDHAFFKKPSIRRRLNGALLAAAVVVVPILVGALLFLVFGAS
ncbi:hypothetical protein Brsp05_04467 [Brucella sp. NBRC 12953]